MQETTSSVLRYQRGVDPTPPTHPPTTTAHCTKHTKPYTAQSDVSVVQCREHTYRLTQGAMQVMPCHAMPHPRESAIPQKQNTKTKSQASADACKAHHKEGDGLQAAMYFCTEYRKTHWRLRCELDNEPCSTIDNQLCHEQQVRHPTPLPPQKGCLGVVYLYPQPQRALFRAGITHTLYQTHSSDTNTLAYRGTSDHRMNRKGEGAEGTEGMRACRQQTSGFFKRHHLGSHPLGTWGSTLSPFSRTSQDMILSHHTKRA